MYSDFKDHLLQQLEEITNDGLIKVEREIISPQNSGIKVSSGQSVLNLCANNYLGLAQHPEVNAAARQGLSDWGYGMASVRFICGTQTIHKQLEEDLSLFLGTEETILYPSCFDANGGLFETLFSAEDAIISDELNHASIIDGIRLCKAKRFRYKNNDMADLRAQLNAADEAGSRYKIITTDGVFSMDGTIAKLDEICDLADEFKALVHFDDCHATGFVGKLGKGTHEYSNCIDRVDIITGTLGKALGGASGGFTSGKKEIVEILRQRSRPYLFSNTVAPPVVAGAIKAVSLLQSSSALREKLESNTKYFREKMVENGFDIVPGNHPIVPVMLYDAKVAKDFASRMLTKGIYVIAFAYPVVPKDKARIRTQISAAHSIEELQNAITSFREVKEDMEL